MVFRRLGVGVTGGWRCTVSAVGNVAERWTPQLSLSSFFLSRGLCPPSWVCLMAFRLNWTRFLAARVAVSHRRDVGTASLGAAWVRLLVPPHWEPGASLPGVTRRRSASLGPKQGWLCSGDGLLGSAAVFWSSGRRGCASVLAPEFREGSGLWICLCCVAGAWPGRQAAH